MTLHHWMLVGALALAACGGKDNGPAPIEVEGAWSGTLTDQGTQYPINFTLTETSGTVTGNGAITGPGGAIAFTVSGTYSEPNFSATLSSQGTNPLNVTATVSETSMTGTGNGSGFTNAALSMTRQ